MRYGAVVFDLWDTLVLWPTDDDYDNLIDRMAGVVGVEPSRFQEAWHAEYDSRWTGGFVQSVHAVCTRLGVPTDAAEEIAGIRTGHTRKVLVPRSGALGVLSTLRERGYPLGLISNCSGDVETLWEQTALAPHIDEAVLSCAVGLRKPDREIYEIAAERLGVATGDCLFVDDQPDFVRGAREAGMDAYVLGAPPVARLEDVLQLAE